MDGYSRRVNPILLKTMEGVNDCPVERVNIANIKDTPTPPTKYFEDKSSPRIRSARNIL